MALDEKQLEKLLNQKNSQKRIVEFFRGAPEQDRRQLSGRCIKHLKARLSADADWSLITPAVYAAYCTSTPSQFDRGWRTQIEGDLVYELLADRRPDWIDDWVQRCCDQLRVRNYPEIRRLSREGLCTPPTDDNFIRMMIQGIGRRSALNGLRKDPELLDEYIWRVFEVPYVMNGPNMVGYLHKDFVGALATLSKQGTLDRRRLFDRIFSATHMGFNREQIKVILSLHDTLKPTPDERQEMFESYASVIESDLPAVVKFAFENLQTLDKHSPIAEERLCEILRATMRSPTKSMVTATLKWLARLCQRNPACTAAASLSASEGLLHPKAEVQAAAWRLIEQQGATTEDVIAELTGLVETTSASVRKQVRGWLQTHAGSDASAEVEDNSGGLDDALALAKKTPRKLAQLIGMPALIRAARSGDRVVPPCEFDGTELARLWDRSELSPIGSLDELVDVAAGALEDPARIDDAERVLDALPRFQVAGNEKALATAGPIIKRSLTLTSRIGAFYGEGANHDLVPVILAWSGDAAGREYLDSLEGRREQPPPGFTGFLAYRSRAIMRRLRDQVPTTVIGLPTHTGGWIDPVVLVRRLKKVKDPKTLVDYDQVLALLRLAPDNRARALKAATNLTGEFAAALRYACGQTGARIGKTCYLWIAAARARAPFEDDARVEKKFPNGSPDAGIAARYDIRHSGKKRKYEWEPHTLLYAEGSREPSFDRTNWWKSNENADHLLPTTLPHETGCHSKAFLDDSPCIPPVFDMAASVWPLARDSFYVPDATPAPLLDPCVPLRPMTSWGLVLGLTEKWAPHRALAVDVSIAAISDGRWDANLMGRLLAVEADMVHRFTKTLTEVASVSLLHSFQVAETLIAMLAAGPFVRTAGFAGGLELLYELLEETQCDLGNPAAVDYLTSITGSSKAARNAKRLLAFTPSGEPRIDAVHEQAIRGRLETERRVKR